MDRVPENCPDEPDAVFTDGGVEAELDKELRLEGRFEFRIEVDGHIEPHPDRAKWLAEGEAYGDDWAEWYLTGSDIVWLYDGTITDIQIGPYEGEEVVESVTAGGEELDLEHGYGSGGYGEGNYGGDDGEEDTRTKDEIIADLEAEVAQLRDENEQLAAELEACLNGSEDMDEESDSLTGKLRDRLLG